MALAPDHAETRMAAGYNYYYLSNDYDRALKEFELARQVQPSLSNALAASGYVHRRLGQMRAAVEYIGRAVELDPNSGRYVFNLGETHLLLRDFDEAESYFARAIELLPVWPRPPSYMARMHLLRDGNFEEARRVLEAAEARGAFPLEDATFLYHWYWVDLVAGDYEAGLKRIDTQAWDVIETQFFVLPAGLLKGELQTLLGNATAAGIQFQVAQSLLRARLLTEPDDERLQSALGRTLAGLRKFDDALTHGARGLELMPRERDAYKTTFRLEDLARIQAAAGNHTEATRHFETLLAGPSLLTAELLRLDPRLTQLRTEPDFAALVGGSQ
jgi:tetratricopeptide (TPR) repeat protein